MLKKQIKHSLLFAMGLFLVLMFNINSANACRVICFTLGDGSRWCGEFEGDCPASCDCDCYSAAAIALPSHVIVTNNGHPYLSEDGKKTDIAGDKLAAFVKQQDRKYPPGKSELSLKIQKQRNAEYTAFFKKYNKSTDTVSKSRLSQIAKESKLKVVNELPK